MADFYERLAATALRMINDKGADCTIETPAAGGGSDPDTGMPLDDGASSSITARCVVANYSDVERNRQDSLIQQNDKKLLIASAAVGDISLASAVTVAGNTYTVVEVEEIKPAETSILFKVRGRV